MRRNAHTAPTWTIWLVVPTATTLGRDVLKGCAATVRQAGGIVRLASGWKLPPTSHLIPIGDAIISIAGSRDELHQLRDRGLVVMNISGRHDPSTLDIPTVTHDGEAAGRLAARHLLGCGHRALTAFTMGKPGRLGAMRIRGFRQAVQEAGAQWIEIDVGRCKAASSRRQRIAFTRRWLRAVEPPLAVMVAADVIAKELLPLCAEAGLRVPQDLALVGIDNDEVLCETLSPTLSSIDLNGARIGHEAASLTLRLLAGEPPPSQPIIVPPRCIVERQSTGRVVSDDPTVEKALTYMRANMADPLGIQDLADTLHLSKRAIERAFKTELDQTPAVFWRELRLDEAARLLVETDWPLQRVSAEVGYKAFQHFCRCFKQYQGETPGEYRRTRRSHA